MLSNSSSDELFVSLTSLPSMTTSAATAMPPLILTARARKMEALMLLCNHDKDIKT
jgi:hypothetical protein